MNATLTSSLRAASDYWSDWMWQISWQLLVLVVVLTLITWALRRQSARLRHALWLLVLVRLVLPPETAFPTGFGWWLGPSRSNNLSSVASLDQSAAELSFNVAKAPGTESESPAAVLSWSMILFLFWSGVMAVRLGMLITAWAQVRSWVGRARPLVDPDHLRLLREVQQKIGWLGKVELRNSEACATPMVVGLWRPVVLLPSTILERLTPAELEAILVHEVTHVRRRDGWIRTIQAVLESVYFFHPAVWWSSFQLRKLREDACDEASVATLGRRKAYGSALVKAAEILGYAAPPLALGVLDSHRPIAERVHRILDPGLPVAPIAKVRYAVVVCLSALILLPAGKRPSPSTAVVPAASVAAAPSVATAPGPVAEAQPPTIREETPKPTVVAGIAHSVDRLADPAQRDEAISELQSYGPAAESDVIRLLARADADTRIAVYDVLGVIGHDAARDILESAYLIRTGVEQFAARRALDAVASRVRSNANQSEGSSSSRFFARQE